MVKRSIFTLMIFSGLLGIYFLYAKPPAAVDGVSKGSVLFPCRSSDEITAIEMERQDRPLLRLERVGAAWQIIKPYRGNADQLIAGGMAVALCKARSIDVIASPEGAKQSDSEILRTFGPQNDNERVILSEAKDLRQIASSPSARAPRNDDLDQFNLDSPDTIKIKVSLKGDTFQKTLLIGAKHPFRDMFYAAWQEEGAAIFLLEGQLVRALNKSEYSLREKRIFHIQDRRVRRITLNLFGSFVRLFYGLDERWHLQEQPEAKLDKGAVEEIFQRIRGLFVKEFLYEENSNGRDFGVADTENTVSVLWEDGSVETLSIGNPWNERNAYYALKGPEDSPLILVAKPNVHALVRRPEDFIDRRVLTLEPQDVHMLEVVYQDKSESFTKSAGDIWRNSSGKDLPVEIQQAVYSMISEMSLLHYDRILPPRGDGKNEKDRNALTSIRFLKENRELIVSFDLLRKGNRYLISRPDRSQIFQISRVDSEVLKSLFTLIQSS